MNVLTLKVSTASWFRLAMDLGHRTNAKPWRGFPPRSVYVRRVLPPGEDGLSTVELKMSPPAGVPTMFGSADFAAFLGE